MNTTAIRDKLYDYIRVADDKSFTQFIICLKMKLNKVVNGGKIKKLHLELDRRYQALESGLDKGFTVEELEKSVSKLRLKKYGK